LRAQAAQSSLRGFSSYRFRRFQQAQGPGRGIPVIALHGAAFIRGDWSCAEGAIRTAIIAEEARRIGQHSASGKGVKAASVGVLDARVGLQRRALGAPRMLDSLLRRKGIDVGMVKVQIAGKRAELGRFRQSGVRIFGGYARQFHRSLHQPIDAIGAEVAGVCARRPLPQEHTQAHCARSRVFEGFNLTQPNLHGKFRAFANHGLSRGGSCLHGAGYDVGCNLRQIGFSNRKNFGICRHSTYRAVPPTVIVSSLSVGIPTPTGTDCLSLPQVPTPSSN